MSMLLSTWLTLASQFWRVLNYICLKMGYQSLSGWPKLPILTVGFKHALWHTVCYIYSTV